MQRRSIATATALLIMTLVPAGCAPASVPLTQAPASPPVSTAATVTPVSATSTAVAPPSSASSAPTAPSAESRRILGRSVAGVEIALRRFGAGQRRVLVVGGIHGDEYGTSVARKFAAYLTDNPEAIPAGAAIDVIECLNPDGVRLDTRGNENKVDLNRNMPASTWAPELDRRDSSYARHCTPGASPGSEPEAQAFMRALDNGYAAVVMLHSSGGLVDFDGEGGEALARRMAEECGLPVQHLAYQPYIHGSVGQYVPEKYGIPVITLELESGNLGSGVRRALLVAAKV